MYQEKVREREGKAKYNREGTNAYVLAQNFHLFIFNAIEAMEKNRNDYDPIASIVAVAVALFTTHGFTHGKYSKI